MSPLPLEITPGMFSGLSNLEFKETVDATVNLNEVRPKIITPENHIIFLNPDSLEIGIDQALLYPDNILIKYLQTVTDERKNIIPQHRDQIKNAYPFLESCGIKVGFESLFESVSVYRSDNHKIALLEHKYDPDNEFDSALRLSIAGLALIPDTLWDTVAKNGLVIGEIQRGKNKPRFNIWSMMLMDQKNTITFCTINEVLQSLTPGIINSRINQEHSSKKRQKMEDFLRNVRPVGLFSDTN